MDAEFHINQKKFTFKQVINDLHKIYLICTDNCKYCKDNKIETAHDKLNLIKKILVKYFGDENEQ